MSFTSLSQPAIGPLIQRFAEASHVTLIVGAGASMEASLPSWPSLVERLLRGVAADSAHLDSDSSRDEWVKRTLEREDLLAAGAVVEVMANEDLDALLPAALYGDGGPQGYEPGPIAEQAAYLWECFGDRLAILTTNYDDLIERALAKRGLPQHRIKSYVRRWQPPDGAVAVTHLHGLAGRSGAPKQLVLTEEHYHRMQRGKSWQERYVTERLAESHCLFIGTSLSDPNLIRYLYGYRKGGRRHAALFVRQGDLDGAPEGVSRAHEQAVEKRWARQGVEAVFVDHFGDAAQLLYEIGLRRSRGDGYIPVGERAARMIGNAERRLFAVSEDGAFAERQILLSRWLRDLLYELLATATGGLGDLDGERLAVALWVLGADGTTITAWAHSDRAHQDPATVEAIPISSASEWAAVRAICQGVRVDHETDSPLSRWRFVRGIPLVLHEGTRLPIGCVTVSSTKPVGDTVLNSLPPTARAELHRGLLAGVEALFAVLPATPVKASAA